MSTHVQDRRRHDLRGRIARATFPVRYSFGEFIEGLPCNLIGHHFKEVPQSHLSARDRARGRMRFRCTRCFLMAGFTN